MRILLLESQAGAADAAADALAAEGHDTTRCHRPGAPAFPCLGMDDHRCPIDTSVIDVAVAVERAGSADGALAPGLQGTRCAVRRFIPVVVVDPDAASAFAPHATTVCHTADPDAVVAAVDEAARQPLPLHSEVATTALRGTLALHGLPAAHAVVRVLRDGADLRAVLVPGVDLDEHEREVASIRVLAAIKALDPAPARVSVTVD